ncbi:hypothetical protein JT358_10565 [Micrococcales bacterium 31B]|nr:hypothetical protein [Micrococcales bacterium 31B]
MANTGGSSYHPYSAPQSGGGQAGSALPGPVPETYGQQAPYGAQQGYGTQAPYGAQASQQAAQSSPYATPYADVNQGYPQQDAYYVPPQPHAAQQPQVVVNTYHAMAPQYMTPPPQGLSTASMWLGIASVLFGWTFFLPVVGLVLGILGLKREPAGRGKAITGLVINGLLVSGWALLVIFVFGLFGLAATAGAVS